MSRVIPESELDDIVRIVQRFSEGASASEILAELHRPIPLRTLQHRLKYLVTQKRLTLLGQGRGARYFSVAAQTPAPSVREPEQEASDEPLSISTSALAIRDYVRQPLSARKPVGYVRRFLASYRPNKSSYLSKQQRAHLHAIGKQGIAPQPAGTYARQILNRLLIDLAWNSSRLEGNTYSLLDTKRLLEFGQEARGRAQLETQMILNHKDAIEFLVNAADEIDFNRYTILNLHALLANNLLQDSSAVGRLRRIAVGIDGSVFYPLESPQLIEECFDRLLATAASISDPFEQAFFFMVQLPYLQPFDDVNKRVSRIGANIPLIKANLAPLSFADVPRHAYTEAHLGVYELNQIDLLRDIFIWAYERSAARYAAVRQSLGEPDPFRLRYRTQIRDIVASLIRARVHRKAASPKIEAWARKNIAARDRQRFIEVIEDELSGLHEGNFARYQIRPSEFAAWRKVWTAA